MPITFYETVCRPPTRILILFFFLSLTVCCIFMCTAYTVSYVQIKNISPIELQKSNKNYKNSTIFFQSTTSLHACIRYQVAPHKKKKKNVHECARPNPKLTYKIVTNSLNSNEYIQMKLLPERILTLTNFLKGGIQPHKCVMLKTYRILFTVNMKSLMVNVNEKIIIILYT